MMLLQPFAALTLLVSTTVAQQMMVNAAAHEEYASGAVMDSIMARKMTKFNSMRAMGAYESNQYPEIGFVPCEDGYATAIMGDANSTFRCSNINLHHFLSHQALGSAIGEGSSSWGWTSEDGREFIAQGQADGAAFIEIMPEGKMVYLGRLPAYSKAIIWREIRGYKNFMIIGSEAVDHNIQIFDMEKLLDVDSATPVTFSNDKDLTGLFKGLPNGRTHNVVVNEETDWIYAVGAQPRNSACKSGLIFIDMSDPSNPVSPGCASADGYTHDAQCLIYHGPSTKYEGKEICYAYNEDALTIWDVEDKMAPKIISKTSYHGVAYCHQGWVLDKANQEYLIMDDELDEVRHTLNNASQPTTYIWDIRNLEHPKQTGSFKSEVVSIDHNQYIYDGWSYQSNYGSGLRVVDVSSIPEDPSGNSVEEVGFFDVYPEDDMMPGGGQADFQGTWSSYAGFESGFIFVNSIERGAFLVKIAKDQDE